MRRLFIEALRLICLVGLVSCSGGDAGGPAASPAGSLAAAAAGDGNAAAPVVLASGGFTLEVLPESFVPGGQASFCLTTADGEGTTAVVLTAREATGLKAVYFDLHYDAREYVPDEAYPSTYFAQQGLVLVVLDDTGVVYHGQVLRNWDRQRGFCGSGELARVQFRRGSMLRDRVACNAPLEAASQGYAQLNLGTPELIFHYFNKGDYDQNGEVNAADLTPLGLHFGETGPWEYYYALHAVDGDSNGEINAADVTPIGANFGHNVVSYNVYASSDWAADYPASADTPSAINPLGSIALADCRIGPPDERRYYCYELSTTPTPQDVYWVRPFDGAVEGIASRRSNEPCGYGNNWPLVYFTTDTLVGDAPLTVTFDASASYDPDGSPLLDFFAQGNSGGDIDSPHFFMDPGPLPVFAYTITEPGNYRTYVNASDGIGSSSSSAVTISVLDNGNYVPTAVLFVHEPRDGDVPHVIKMDLSNSYDPESAVLHYEFDVWCPNIEHPLPRDDYEQDNLNDPVYEFTATEAGYYEIRGRVTDGDGQSNVDYAGRVDVTHNGNYAPRATLRASSYSGAAPLAVEFTVEDWMLEDQDGTIVSAEIDPEGDQNWQVFDTVNGYVHVYAAAGEYHPRLRVVDDDGLAGYSLAEMTISVY